VVAIALIVFSSCKNTKEPYLNYSVEGYLKAEDWNVAKSTDDSISSYWVNKKIKLDLETFTNDSVKFEIDVEPKDVNKLPKQDTLEMKLFKALLDSKYSCKNEATFNPKKIQFYFTEWDGKECYKITIQFLASNSFGVPGELTGHYYYDVKTNEPILEKVF
jgi:hypothetical protein